MEQSNKIQRSEVWEQIYKIVKTIPRADCNGMDAPDAPSVATELEELFLKLLPIQYVSKQSELLCGFFEPKNDSSSATICKHCGREKWMHPKAT